MKTISALALIAALAAPAVALADGFPDGDPFEIQKPIGTTAEPRDDIERKTWLPYREGPVDEVQPQDVMPLVKADGPATRAALSQDADTPAVCAGQSAMGWEATAGLRLQQVLDAWAACEGWSVHWQTDRQYVLEASATFSGDFVTAAAELVGAFGQAEPPAFGEFYQANKVLVITTPTELDAR